MRKPWQENEILFNFRTILTCAKELHKNYLFHRDIKPGNIIYSSEDKMWKLTDFGEATKCENYLEE